MFLTFENFETCPFLAPDEDGWFIAIANRDELIDFFAYANKFYTTHEVREVLKCAIRAYETKEPQCVVDFLK